MVALSFCERLFYLAFENDVILYGSQTENQTRRNTSRFENDVILYGSQTQYFFCLTVLKFENDVILYGSQTNNLFNNNI